MGAQEYVKKRRKKKHYRSLRKFHKAVQKDVRCHQDGDDAVLT